MFRRDSNKMSLMENSQGGYFFPVILADDCLILNNWYGKSLLGNYLRYPGSEGTFLLVW